MELTPTKYEVAEMPKIRPHVGVGGELVLPQARNLTSGGGGWSPQTEIL